MKSLITTVASFALILFAGSYTELSACGSKGKSASSYQEKATGTGVAKVSLDVTGMMCGHCAKTVMTALIDMKGVKSVSVDSTTGKAIVVLSDKSVSNEALEKAIEDTEKFTGKVTTRELLA